MTTPDFALAREALVRRGLRLNYVTIAYNAAEAIISLVAGALAGSVALVGFGIDSVIEVTASGAAQWRLRSDTDPATRHRVERISLRVVGACFLGLAAYVTYESGRSLWLREEPDRTALGIAITALSLIVMPLLARAKRRVASKLDSRALAGEAMQTSVCAYLSAIVLGGLLLNAMFGWWWADPLAALGMVPIITREGIEALHGESCCSDCA